MNDFSQDSPLDCGWIMLDMPQNWQGRKTPEQKAELSRRAHALTDGMRLPHDEKLSYSLRVIERALAMPGVNWAVSFSGGRDSTILSHMIVEVLGQKIPHVMSNTRMEYPEVMRQAGRWKKWLAERGVTLSTAFPDKRPAEVWAEGYPLWGKEVARKYRIWANTGNPKHFACIPAEIQPVALKLKAAGVKVTDTCCDRLKKEPMAKWDKEHGIGGHFTGIRCEESQARRLMYIQRGSLYNSVAHGQWLAHPLTHWKEADLVRYVQKHGLEIERNGRSGCITCGFGAHLCTKDKRENALQRLARENPKMWAVAMDDWGYRKALDIAGIDYGQFAADQARRAEIKEAQEMFDEDAEALQMMIWDNVP